MRLRNHQRGDTLVEVLLATVVISVVLAGAFSLSARALRLNQTATERTEVVNKMREQVEVLRFVHQSRNDTDVSNVWTQILNYSNSPSPRAFYFNIFDGAGNVRAPDSADYVEDYDVTTPGVDTYDNDFFGIRVQPIPHSSGEYIDFQVKADWEGIGGVGDQSATNVLRLNL